MGRPPKYNDLPLPEGVLRGEFCATMRKLADKYGLDVVVEKLDKVGATKATVYHSINGRSMPKIDDLPDWARALGLKSWRSFFKS